MPEIAGVYCAKREEGSVLVERELGFRGQIAAVKIGQKVRNASRRSHTQLTGRPTRFAAQATRTNSGQVLLQIPK